MNPYWSYLLTAVGVLGLYLAGRRKWWAWLIGLGAQGLWVAYAVATEQWGFIVSAFAYGLVYARNARSWWRAEHPPAKPPPTHVGSGSTGSLADRPAMRIALGLPIQPWDES